MRRVTIWGILTILLTGCAPSIQTIHSSMQVTPIPTVAPIATATVAQRSLSHVTLKEISTPTPRPSPTPSPTPGPVRILFVGDSLTAGYYATTLDKSFRSIVTTYKHGVPLSPGVHYGIRADEVLTEIQSGVITIPSADIIVLELGTNDFTGVSFSPTSTGPEPQVTFNTDYDKLAQIVRAASPKAQLVCLSIWMPQDGWDGQAYASSYDQAIQSSCVAAHGTYVDISQFYAQDRGPAGTSTFQGPSDDFHPNDVGHGAIAQAIEAALK